MTEKELCMRAKQAMENAYVPYSGFRVGAALLCADGAVYTGCNIENASFTPTVCAERTAVFKAVSEGRRDFAALAVASGKASGGDASFPPCGVCRQVLAEFCAPDMPVYVLGAEGEIGHYTLKTLLPFAFTPEFMR
ncbi:MAG: cytidine deaminase [Clostridia bacterium]|nr:cytidine deaminase [Clostridia bacterium]